MRIPKDRLPASTVSNPNDPRRAPRLAEREMVVEYWDGVAPAGPGIRDISESGAYIRTTEKWYSGAIIKLSFRGREPKTSVSVLAQVVRQGADGFAMEFLFNTFRQREDFRKFLASLPPVVKTPPQSEPAPAAPAMK
ncbi:MAG TPA: PilZ domain-containing protein [Bryobacteraceae bacterium]|nr:PilZ domain-containing protein [Bryobacteraceae bacterium]